MENTERKLATVRRIAEIKQHPNADLLDIAVVDGWQLVTAKANGFKAGDLVIYCEVDSFLPVCEKFEWLRQSSYKRMGEQEGFRLKTIKLRGELSQGLILPLEDLPFDLYPDVVEGDDVTEALGIVKWDPPLPAQPAQLAGIAKGNFPSFVPKTDLERIQNIIGKMNYEVPDHIIYEATLKLDGSSCTIYYNDGKCGVCSRNIDLEETESNTFWSTVRKLKIIEALERTGMNVALQGELMGPSIQGNRENLPTTNIYIFDVYLIDDGIYLSGSRKEKYLDGLRANGALITEVPLIDKLELKSFKNEDGKYDVNKFLKYADRESIKHSIAEGVVFKRMDYTRHNFKVINNQFLLKEK